MNDLEIGLLAIGGIEWCEDLCSCEPEVNYYCTYCAIHAALTRAISQLRWRDSAKELPADGETVLCRVKYSPSQSEFLVATRLAYGWIDNTDCKIQGCVDRWQPIGGLNETGF